MKRNVISVCLILIIMIFSSISISAEDSNNAKVKYFNRDIVINEEKIINFQSAYPYFVYNDIVYLPLTWENGNILGFKTNWDLPTLTLGIKKSEITQKNYTQKRLKTNNAYLTVTKSSVKVVSEGKELDTQGYPIFDYKSATYVPLTYSVVRQFFGWDMYFDTYAGLYISTDETQTAKNMVDKASANYNMGIAKYIQRENGDISESKALELALLIREKSKIYNVDERLVVAVMNLESNFDSTIISHAGAIGLMQIMDSTGIQYGLTPQMLRDPSINTDFGVKYLKENIDLYKGDVKKALSAYNQGPVRVSRGTYSTKYYEIVMSRYNKLERYLVSSGYAAK